MPSDKNTRTTFDILEQFFMPYKRFTSLEHSQQSSIKQQYNLLASDGYVRNTWKFVFSRIIPVRIKGKMRFFPEVIVERRQFPLRHREYLKFKRKDQDFNYGEIFKVSETAHVDNRGELFLIDWMEMWDYKKDEPLVFSYEWLAKKHPKLMAKTLKEAQKRINDFISKKSLVYY